MSGTIDANLNEMPADIYAGGDGNPESPENENDTAAVSGETISGDEALKFAESLEREATENARERLSEQEAIAEALVFASGEPVKIDSIAIAINSDKKEAYKVMDGLVDRYRRRAGGIILRKIDKSYLFCTRPELTENLRPFFERSTGSGLTRAAMETLAVICYNQPVTRAGIEYVRGINSDGVLIRLIEKGLVEEAGRSDAPGRPILYVTTPKFLQALGVESIKDLPKVEKVIIREPKADQPDAPAGENKAEDTKTGDGATSEDNGGSAE